jgi:glycosyltransferase involved in cell wall biosynthesis
MTTVLQVAHGWPGDPGRPWGGAERVAAALFEGLADERVESWAFAALLDGAGWERSPARERLVRVSVDPAAATRFRDTWERPLVAARFADLLDEIRPDVVHFHHLTHLSLDLPRIAGRTGALTVLTLHDYWLPCVRGQLLDRQGRRCAGPSPGSCATCVGGQLALGPIGARVSRRLRASAPAGRFATTQARLAATMREGLGSMGRPLWRRHVRERLEAVHEACSWIRRFVSPSRDLAERFGALGFGGGRVGVMPLPLLDPLAPAPPPGRGPLRLLYIGPIFPTKGAERLVNAFLGLPRGRATLRLVGPRVPSDVDPLHVERILSKAADREDLMVEGPVPPHEVEALLHASDLLVVPSLWEENSPLVLREAAAVGLRVLASRRGGMPELLPEARFFEPETPGDLERALRAELDLGRGRAPLRAFPDRRTWVRETRVAYERWGWHDA